MGACASVLKANKGDGTAMPPPEQPKEETPTTEVVSAAATEGGDDKKEEKAAAAESNESQSLGTLLVEGEAPKEKVGEESAAEVLPVSDPVAPAEEKPTDAATPQPTVVAA